MKRQHKEALAQAQQVVSEMGGEVIEAWENRGHLRATIRRPNGSRFRTTFAGSPSDWRASRNARAQLRRKMRGVDLKSS